MAAAARRHGAADRPARTLLDAIAPAYDVASQHTLWVAAAPADVYHAARRADLARPWLVRLLMALRAGPAGLADAVRGRRPRGQARDRLTVGSLPFTLVAEAPGEEFVLGLMGRFWTWNGGVVAATPDRFRQPPPAGLAQALWNFRVEPAGDGATLSTETRVRCGDAATRRKFARYWRLVRLGSGVIRRSMLRHIRREAQQRHRA